MKINAILCSLFLFTGVLQAADENDFVEFSAENLPGRLYIPPEAQESARPLILFLHGAGETGSDNLLQINGNIDNLLASAKDRGAFLYAPQATTVAGSIFNWNDVERTNGVMAKVDEVLANQNADPNRVYITGLSMGGGGAWNMASRYPNRFAAAVPIAGVRTATDFDADSQLSTPTWAFHARNDSIVSKDRSREVVNSMLSAAGKPTLEFPANTDRETTFEFVNDDLNLRYTEFPTGDHFIWSRVYNTPEMYDWVFAQAVPEPGSAILNLLAAASLLSLRRRR